MARTVGTIKKYNDDFFELEGIAQWYVLGAIFGCTKPLNGHTFTFSSPNSELVDIVRRELTPNHAIIEDNRPGRDQQWIIIRSARGFSLYLREYGIDKPKNDRKLPEVPVDYLSHFIRGFMERQRRTSFRSSEELHLLYNLDFLVSLNAVAIEQAQITGGDLRDDRLVLKGNDVVRFHNWVYSGWEQIQKPLLYCPSVKVLFGDDFPLEEVHDAFPASKETRYSDRRQERNRRVGIMVDHIVSGGQIANAWRLSGYTTQPSASRAFSEKMGCRCGYIGHNYTKMEKNRIKPL